ncbi:hypothetical protein [Pseudoruegeria sp. SK021]|uniref:hypothetical protein n=1 Tax=Pseudoruegeria sp. SK021 TaxID=1933035 RepID=UPI00111C625B|nr:hypothetical protein [Pseudoruegeria sp. SK021]
MFKVVLCSILLALAACSSTALRPPTMAASDDTQLHAMDLIDSSREFEAAVVGQRLKGSGVDVTVAPDGILVGRALGRPFVGGWVYRKGVLCTSLTEPNLKVAADRKCFRAAVHGREVFLVPLG